MNRNSNYIKIFSNMIKVKIDGKNQWVKKSKRALKQDCFFRNFYRGIIDTYGNNMLFIYNKECETIFRFPTVNEFIGWCRSYEDKLFIYLNRKKLRLELHLCSNEEVHKYEIRILSNKIYEKIHYLDIFQSMPNLKHIFISSYIENGTFLKCTRGVYNTIKKGKKNRR